VQPSGVITITTDFGHKGPFVGVMKGVILQRFRDAQVIDLTHEVPAQWPPEAGFWVRRSYRYFPPGTVHVAIVDPGVGTERDILVIEYDHHYFMAPDNGLLGRMLDHAEGALIFRLDLGALERLNIPTPSNTFHGRDIFAPIAAELAAGKTTPVSIGVATDSWIPAWVDEPEIREDSVTGSVMTVDGFGNLISNIDAELVAGFDRPVVKIGGKDIPLLKTYGNVKPGEYLALINSFGVVEVALAEGDAARGLGVERGAPISVVS
jgi:S-adenosylmethionine hydrolase